MQSQSLFQLTSQEMRVQGLKAGAYDGEQTYFTLNKNLNQYILKRNKKMVKIPVVETEFIVVEDGLHEGWIISAEPVNKGGYDWIEVSITCDDLTKKDGEAIELKTRYGATLTENSMLGQMIERVMNIKIDADKMKDFELTDLRGKPVVYLTTTDTVKSKDGGKDKTYTNILRDTVKYAKN